MPKLNGPLVCSLLYDGLCTFEFGIVAEVFALKRPEMGPNWYRFASCAIDTQPMQAHGGLTFTATHTLSYLRKADIIVIPGWRGVHEPVPESLRRALLRAHQRGARLVSICSGAFVLADTGLLSGGTATTHWRYADCFRQMFPTVTVDAHSLYQKHDRIYTSAGSAAGIDLLIDLLIEIVREDFGPAAANSVARRLVMSAHRSGGQAQFLERPVPASEIEQISPLMDAMRSNLAKKWTIASMSSHSRMSMRTFIRRFIEATGQSPGDWLVSERIIEAQRLLRQDTYGIEAIARAVGFGNTHGLRHHFRRRIGIGPLQYRARFLQESNSSR